MSTPKSSIPAIVLRYTDYAEADRIVHLLTKEYGVISAMVRGARASKKKYSGLIDLGNLLDVTFSSTKGEIWTLQKASAQKSMLRTRGNLHKLAFLSYACELISYAAQAGNPEPKLFGLLENLLHILEEDDGRIGPRFRIAFELKLLTFAGYMPQLKQCMACGGKITSDISIFSTEGGVFHNYCLPQIDSPSKVIHSCSLLWLQEVYKALKSPMRTSLSVEMLAGPQWVFAQVFSQIYQKPIKAKSFLASLETPL